MHRTCMSEKWPAIAFAEFESARLRPEHANRRADGGERADEQADEAERMDGEPLVGPRRHLVPREVHLDGEVDGERPEGEGAEQPDDLVEVGEPDGQRRGRRHVRRAEAQPEHVRVHAARARHRQQRRLDDRGPAAELAVREREHRLRVHLVAAEEVENDGEVGEVDEPVGLVEAEAGEEVARGAVAERRVAKAPAAEVEEGGDSDARSRRLFHRLALRRRRPQRVLYFQQHQRERVGEQDVPEGLRDSPHLLRRGHQRDASDAAHDHPVCDDFGDAEADADEGVEAGHDGGEDGEPRHLVEVGYLRQQHLREAEEQHVVAVSSHRARRVVAFPVVAIGLPDRPAERRTERNRPRHDHLRLLSRPAQCGV
uniref:Uncharacterized protein n=1 Tax=Zea mays TaxID=4577 RepID=B7ZZ26_MAIZE|nr:unknown [Zea mays]